MEPYTAELWQPGLFLNPFSTRLARKTDSFRFDLAHETSKVLLEPFVGLTRQRSQVAVHQVRAEFYDRVRNFPNDKREIKCDDRLRKARFIAQTVSRLTPTGQVQDETDYQLSK